ncbi:MAG: OmpA family protein [Myxococcales bacterium]|nr:OmpA family protein [Myxococcales bacterium]
MVVPVRLVGAFPRRERSADVVGPSDDRRRSDATALRLCEYFEPWRAGLCSDSLHVARRGAGPGRTLGARAESVQRYLIGKGVPASRMQARGFGESQPEASNDTDEGRALNRRVELSISN